ncbi:MAG: DUF3795 domain-containing protein [Treponema sp.]|nr:MAG: DUF3795 domain-containing protein [Treponema sp.]
MDEYRRFHPEFSLCGLNCSLCPRRWTEGSSRCPGCGAPRAEGAPGSPARPGFSDIHPTCAVITCAKKRGSPEFCFLCADYPCDRYRNIGTADSFISYRHVKENLAKAQENLDSYLDELAEREAFLALLLDGWNDSRRKGFYCLAANDLPIGSVREVCARLVEIDAQDAQNGADGSAECVPCSTDRARTAVRLLSAEADKAGFALALRK